MVSYNRLWETMEKRKISQYRLIKEFGLSSGQMSRLKKNTYVSTHTLETLCRILDCRIEDVMEVSFEDEKSENEPLKLWGHVEDGKIVNATLPVISAQCLRVACSDGHMAAVSVSFKKKPTIEQIKERWANYETEAQRLELPSAPKPFLQYFEDPSRPQTRLDRDFQNGFGVSIGRLREDKLFDYRFVCLSHNTVRGAAGGGILTAELLCRKGYIPHRV